VYFLVVILEDTLVIVLQIPISYFLASLVCYPGLLVGFIVIIIPISKNLQYVNT
jgi:hypothetical protein